jgi:limonene-1,2-epoxide hydrolase
VAVDAFRAAVEAGDLDALMRAMSDDVVLRSPVTFKPYEGKEDVRKLLEIIMRTFEDFTYVHELEGDRASALVFRARVGDRQLDGLDLIEFDDEGRVQTLTVMVRPMSAVIALAETVGPQLAA